MRLIFFIFIYLCSCNCYCRSVSLQPYEIVNDTIIHLLDNYVFNDEKECHKEKKITLSISRKDTLIWIHISISIEKGVPLFCERMEEPPLGYVKYKDMKYVCNLERFCLWNQIISLRLRVKLLSVCSFCLWLSVPQCWCRC